MGKITTLVSTDVCNLRGTPVSSHVIKRIGEAASGYPNDTPMWYVCPRDPRGGGSVTEYETCEKAVAALPDAERYMVLGPVFRPKPPKKSARTAGIAGASVVDTPLNTITLTFDDPDIDPVVLSAKEWDALFWGPVSVDKFAVPYYVGATGIEYGLTVYNTFHGTNVGCRAEALGEEPPTAYALVHEPDTDYTVFYLPGTQFIEEPQELPL